MSELAAMLAMPARCEAIKLFGQLAVPARKSGVPLTSQPGVAADVSRRARRDDSSLQRASVQ